MSLTSFMDKKIQNPFIAKLSHLHFGVWITRLLFYSCLLILIIYVDKLFFNTQILFNNV